MVYKKKRFIRGGFSDHSEMKRRRQFHENFVKSTCFVWKNEKVTPFHTVEKYYKPRSRLERKNEYFFRQIKVFTKEVTKELISFHGNFLRARFLLYFSASQCGN